MTAHPAQPAQAVSPALPAQQAGHRWRAGLRRHWVIAALLVLAAALRAVVLLAYRPALIFPDSYRYLQFAERFLIGHWVPDEIRPSGYSLLLMPVVKPDFLVPVPVLQHLLGLAEGVLVYAVLARLGSRRWVAAVAAVPVLFDPLQLILEQYILSDVLAMFGALTALVVLVWNGNRAGWRAAAACGLLLGATAMTRMDDALLIVPAIAYLGLVVRPWRRLAARAGVLAGCFLVVAGGYATWYWAARGQFGLSGETGTFMYGRVVQFADCTGLPMPAYERVLCPSQPPGQRNPDFYTWQPEAPLWTFKPPPGKDRQSIALDFARRVILRQPLTYLGAVGTDFAYGFSPVRGNGPENYPDGYLRFARHFPPYVQVDEGLRIYGHTRPRVEPTLAAFLQGYGRGFYIPGPLLAAGLLASLAALAGTRRSRRSGLRPAVFVFTAATVVMLASAAAFAIFDWRYQVPQLSLIPVAAASSMTALAGGRRTGPETTAGTSAPRRAPATRI